MNRLVTGNLSLVTGDLQKLIPSVKPFSISSYQLPATSYKSKRFMVPTRGTKPWRLPMNLAIRTGRSPGPGDLRWTIYDGRFTMDDLRGSDGVLAALRDSHARRSARRGARKSHIVNRQSQIPVTRRVPAPLCLPAHRLVA